MALIGSYKLNLQKIKNSTRNAAFAEIRDAWVELFNEYEIVRWVLLGHDATAAFAEAQKIAEEAAATTRESKHKVVERVFNHSHTPGLDR